MRRINGENIHYFESDTESDIQLIFTPGAFNPELWKHQLRYFSKKYKTISFRPTESYRDFKGEKKCLEAILEQEDVDNAVLVSNMAGNAVVQNLSHLDNVKATVMTGIWNRKKLSEKAYKSFWFMAKRKPKLLRKTLFSRCTDYRVLKEFVEDVEQPDFKDIKSFLKKDLQQNEGASLVINAEEDMFSSIDDARKMDSKISVIQRAGSFSFYEKPQDYNKVLNDFLDIVEEKVREEKIKQSAEENRSLIEFDEDRSKVKVTE